MILLRRFVQLFGRAGPEDAAVLEKTQLSFTVNDTQFELHSVVFDVLTNTWIVRLNPPRIEDETISQAIESLRTPAYTFNQVPNVVRQSLADMIELLMVRGRGSA